MTAGSSEEGCTSTHPSCVVATVEGAVAAAAAEEDAVAALLAAAGAAPALSNRFMV